MNWNLPTCAIRAIDLRYDRGEWGKEVAKTPTKYRPLNYRRAVWIGASQHGKTLQELLREALDMFPHVEDTRVLRGDQVLEIRHRVRDTVGSKTNGASLIHMAAYTPKDPASLVPNAAGTPDADLAAMPPPSGAEFLDGDLMALFYESDVCICTSGASEQSLLYYLVRLFSELGYEQSDLNFDIQKVANRSALKTLVSEGVKEITFDVTAYAMSVAVSQQIGFGQALANSLGALFGKDRGVSDLLGLAGVQGHLSLTADGRVQHGAAQTALAGLAEHVVDEDAAGFVIETKTGDRITPSELNIRRYVPISKDAKTIQHAEAWLRLDEFYEFVRQNKLNEF